MIIDSIIICGEKKLFFLIYKFGSISKAYNVIKTNIKSKKIQIKNKYFILILY